MKKLLTLTLFAFLFATGAAFAEESPAAVSAGNCDLAIVLNEEANMTPAVPAELSPLDGAIEVQQGNCCVGLFQACQANCQPQGVFEFNCNPDTCQSSCICNIG